MYQRLGKTIACFPVLTVALWLLIATVIILTAPRVTAVVQEGEFAFLPPEAKSRLAENLYREAFPDRETSEEEANFMETPVVQNPLGSNVVIVLFRENRPSGISAEDRKFINDALIPELRKIALSSPPGHHFDEQTPLEVIPPDQQIVEYISTPDDKRMGTLLTSRDARATLVKLELKSEFLNRQNGLVIERIEQLLKSSPILEQKPIGLAMALSGSATVGRDILRAELESVSRTELLTKFLVIVLLLAIYRAPILALVPLLTVGLSVELTLALLTHLAKLGWIGLFSGLEIYVTVVVYGAGVDYCLFLISRYKEELDKGSSFEESIVHSIHRVGAALATSAGTSIVGIGMMGFAEFGKFRQAGFAISFGLFLAMCCALTFTPALLLLFRKWIFWPDVRREELTSSESWLPSPTLWTRLGDQRLLDAFWNKIADALHRRPGTIFSITVCLMLPFALVGYSFQENLSYGLLTDLPTDEPSVEGANAVQNHFPAGVAGPATVLLKFHQATLQQEFAGKDLTDVRTSENISDQITNSLKLLIPKLEEDDFRIADYRNQTVPLGTSEKAQAYLADMVSTSPRPLITRNVLRTSKHQTYTSLHGPDAGLVMRIDFVFSTDPFERITIGKLAEIESILLQAVPERLRNSTQVFTLGPTAGIRDLKHTTDHDRTKIDILVVIAVYLMLIALLRRPAICAYLMLSVVFSYFVTLGVTFTVFYLRDPEAFTGIDWKVPIYLFTILIAMGEDYNILLMARVQEEQKTRGRIYGILIALAKTGSIISSCGVIMAGTFASLMSGSLLAMVQLGFALAFGVMLDTFLVRPVLVPAYLILLHKGRFGPIGKLLGAEVSGVEFDFLAPDTSENH